MAWDVLLHDKFEPEYLALPEKVQDKMVTMTRFLMEFGPHLGRPHVDTLAGSKHANMKELRFNVEGGVWRVAFAFDPARQAVLLVAGDKGGVNQKTFYKNLIKKADTRLSEWLEG